MFSLRNICTIERCTLSILVAAVLVSKAMSVHKCKKQSSFAAVTAVLL